MAPKSIFRQPGTQHFRLVHRSQRDPLIHDPDASQHVLKAFVRGNDKKGKSRVELEAIISPSDLEHDSRANVGEASLYGVYFDDTEYDYMQHLRAAGEEEEGVDSVWIEAPTSQKAKSKQKQREPLFLRDLPSDALPSTSELPRNYESQEAVPSSIAGFQPDMDPHLRQVLEALEDDAFVDDGLEDNFFGELVGAGEREEGDKVEFEFFEDDLREHNITGDPTEGSEDEDGWETRFAKFKLEQKNGPAGSDSGSDAHSEGGDTVGNLPKLAVVGGKRRRKGTSDASGYSMSSSSMYRTEALLTLDERFDQMIGKEYQSNDEDEEEESSSDLSDEAPDLITSRDDFEDMMNDFLDNYELLGRKMKPVLAGDSGAAKLETLRRAMGQDERVRISNAEEEDTDDQDIFMTLEEDKKDRWDCETVLSTYSNLENHPRLIRAREPKPEPKIRLDPRTGLPMVDGEVSITKSRQLKNRSAKSIPAADDSNHEKVPKETTARPRDESKEEKKARKQAVKAERQVRRADKKATKEQFSEEMKHQNHDIANREKYRVRKL